MTVLVTGATGFLGGRLAEVLRERGEHVRVLVRRKGALEGCGYEIAHGRLEDPESLRRAVAGVDVVYHCAGLASDWAPWSEFIDVNVTGVRYLLEAAAKAGCVRRVVHVSTTDVYGYPRVACDESYGIRDVGLPYNRTKGQGEQEAWRVHRETGLPVTVVRPASIYGPRGKDFVVEFARLLCAGSMILIGGGRAPAGLLYVDNAVEAMIAAAACDETVGKAYNLRDETCETWRQYAFDLADGLGVKRPWINLPERPTLAAAWLCEQAARILRRQERPLLTRHAALLLCRDQAYSIDRARRDFGFRSTVSYSEGVERCLAWLANDEGRAALSV